MDAVGQLWQTVASGSAESTPLPPPPPPPGAVRPRPQPAQSSPYIRHCAFCLKICTAARACALCQKRAYCSSECQTADWPAQGQGQGHKNWCQFECGEEDVDWQIADQGGITAKRRIPAGYRIMVERGFTNPAEHPAIGDLEPQNASLVDKFKHNAICNVAGTSLWTVSLRISRLNHDCDANAATYFCINSRVTILYADRDIEAGQEIRISFSHPVWYPLLIDMYLGRPVTCAEIAIARLKMRQDLLETWRIRCPDDCICYSERVGALITRIVELYRYIKQFVLNKQSIQFFDPDEELVRLMDEIPIGAYSLLRLGVYDLLFDFVLLQMQQSPDLASADDSHAAWYARLANKLISYAMSSYRILSAISPFSNCSDVLKEKMISCATLRLI